MLTVISYLHDHQLIRGSDLQDLCCFWEGLGDGIWEKMPPMVAPKLQVGLSNNCR